MGLLAKASVAIGRQQVQAVNSRDNNFTKGKMEAAPGADPRRALARYLASSTPPIARQLPVAALGGACGQTAR